MLGAFLSKESQYLEQCCLQETEQNVKTPSEVMPLEDYIKYEYAIKLPYIEDTKELPPPPQEDVKFYESFGIGKSAVSKFTINKEQSEKSGFKVGEYTLIAVNQNNIDSILLDYNASKKLYQTTNIFAKEGIYQILPIDNKGINNAISQETTKQEDTKWYEKKTIVVPACLAIVGICHWLSK